ncbi:MAG TPA: class I SAM-dependent methyltransferase [Humibacter sp.]|nr:class I SAM-dependent methyltransferase [Humibacter sp.]
MPQAQRWNHNSHYHRLALAAIPEGARTGLDIGFGDGDLVLALASRLDRVVGVDADVDVVLRAREASVDAAAAVTLIRGDALQPRLPGEPFDVVTCFAALHHLPLDAALQRMRDLTAPGGVLVIVGLARDATVWDRIVSSIGVPANGIARALRGEYRHGAPTIEPRESYGEVRAAARRILPGVRYRRRLYWRYSLLWRKPA